MAKARVYLAPHGRVYHRRDRRALNHLKHPEAVTREEALKRSKRRRLIRLSRQSQGPPSSNLGRFARSLRAVFDQFQEHIPVTRLRLAPAAEHLSFELLLRTSDELRLPGKVLPELPNDLLPGSVAADFEGIPQGELTVIRQVEEATRGPGARFNGTTTLRLDSRGRLRKVEGADRGESTCYEDRCCGGWGDRTKSCLAVTKRRRFTASDRCSCEHREGSTGPFRG